jgi:hypothetical protein
MNDELEMLWQEPAEGRSKGYPAFVWRGLFSECVHMGCPLYCMKGIK